MRIRASLKVEKEAERAGERIRVHLPVPVEQGQARHVRLLGTSQEPMQTAPSDYPQRTVCMETKLEPGQEFWVEYEFENHTRYVELGQQEKEAGVGAEAKTPGVGDRENGRFDWDRGTAPYLEEQLPHIRFTPYLRALTGQVTAGRRIP